MTEASLQLQSTNSMNTWNEEIVDGEYGQKARKVGEHVKSFSKPQSRELVLQLVGQF